MAVHIIYIAFGSNVIRTYRTTSTSCCTGSHQKQRACLNPSFSPKARKPGKRPNTMSFNSRNIRKRIKRTCQMCTSGDSAVVCPPSVQKSSQKTRKREEEILAWGTSRASRASRSLGKEFSTSSFRKFYHVSWTASTLRTHYGQDIPKQMSVRIKECH